MAACLSDKSALLQHPLRFPYELHRIEANRATLRQRGMVAGGGRGRSMPLPETPRQSAFARRGGSTILPSMPKRETPLAAGILLAR